MQNGRKYAAGVSSPKRSIQVLFFGGINMRKSGILMHISSLPSEFGIGKLGDSAYMFANFLRDCGVHAANAGVPRRSATNRSCRAIPKTGSVFLNAPLSLCAFILSHLPAFVKSRRDGIINERFGFPRGFLCFFHRTKIFITLCVGTERDGSGKTRMESGELHEAFCRAL